MFKDRSVASNELLKKYSELSRWKSPLLCVVIYIFCIGLAWLGSSGSGWFFAPFSVLIIAGLQNHLSILLHEGAHFLIHPDRKTNDLVSDVFCAIPLLSLLRDYRVFHLDHHKNTGDPILDPERPLYKKVNYHYGTDSTKELIVLLLKDLSGLTTIPFLLGVKSYSLKMQKEGKIGPITGKEKLLHIYIWGPVIFLAVYYQLWLHFFIFWFLPLFAIMPFLLKVHAYGEHTGRHPESEFEKTLTHHFDPITNFFYYPIKSGYHMDHHLFPRIPWYNMEGFRKELMKNEEYRKRIEIWSVDGIFFGRRTILKEILQNDKIGSDD